MATVRLFARLRELAGSARIEVDDTTVGAVIDELNRRFGPDFALAVKTARVWRNGEEADLDDALGSEDEIALLPPVSGGGMATTMRPDVTVAIPIVATLALVIINLQADAAWWAAGLVAVAGVWVIDIATQMELRGRDFPAVGVALGAVAGAVTSETMGGVGLAIGLALAIVIVMTWGVGVVRYRSVEAVAPGVLVGLLAAGSVGSLVLTRSSLSPDLEAIDVFLFAVILASLLGTIVERLADMPYLDPYSVTAITAILGSVGMAFFRDLDVAGYMLIGLGLAVTLVAGRGLGALLRTGSPALAERVPGYCRAFDGAILAAFVYFPLIRLIL